MTSNKNNIIFEKTSFLQGSNGPFIKEVYLQYLENPANIPQSWKDFFDGLDEDKEIDDLANEEIPFLLPKDIYSMTDHTQIKFPSLGYSSVSLISLHL